MADGSQSNGRNGSAPNGAPGCDYSEEYMIGIIGKKLGMTQVFNDQGQQIPVTVVEAPPNAVLKVTDKAAAGFASVELGFGQQRTARAQQEVGAGYFDDVTTVIQGGSSSVKALTGSTEEEQFH